MRTRVKIVDSLIDHLSWSNSIDSIMEWSERRQSRTVCICNVHSVIAARSDVGLREAINESDLATPDGMPIAWLISKRQKAKQARINGLDLTMRLCEEAAQKRIPVAFYGSSQQTLQNLQGVLAQRFPSLNVAAAVSPPFRPLSNDEDAAMVKVLNDSGAGIVFIGLGCPKQELWMAAHRGQVRAVMIGIGAAFDFLAGTVKRPPLWMQNAGLEWLGRLIAEPRRLWRRYFVTNSIFILYILRELVGLNKSS